MSSDQLILRDLKEGDYHKGYLTLLSQLTVVGDVSESEFKGDKGRCMVLII